MKLDHKTKSFIIKKDTVIKNDLIYEFFKQTPQLSREKLFKKALNIGVMALIEDRISSFLFKTKNELGTELERLKILFDMKTEMFNKSAIKGKYAERDIVTLLNDFFDEKGWKDYAVLTGDISGEIKDAKTGDILTYVNGTEDQKIIIEVKFTEKIPIGDLGTRELTNNTNNIWGQLLKSRVNRKANESIIVFDSTLSQELYDKLGPATYIPNVGYVVFINLSANKLISLYATYSIIRSAIINMKEIKIIKEALYRKIIDRVLTQSKKLLNIHNMIEANIKNNQKILNQIEKSINDLQISKHYLEKLLNNNLNHEDLLNFITGKPPQFKTT